MTTLRLSLLLATLLASPAWAGPAAQAAREPESGARPSLNERFLDPDLDVQRWVQTFEGESREVFAAREEIADALGIRPGHRIADVGAGTGFYTVLFAERAGADGWVYAVEISQRFLEHINRQVASGGIRNVTTVLGQENSVQLPPSSLDLAFVCDTYHHFDQPEAMLASIHRALAPGGALVVVDFERIPGESRQWTLDHVRAGKEVVRAEIEAAGFELVEEPEIRSLRENYVLKFRKK